MDRRLLGRLAEHHERVEELTTRAAELLGKDEPDAGEASRLRWSLTRALTEYQQFKHREIFDPAIARGDAQLVRMSEALKADCTVVGEEFTDYVRVWTLKGAAGHWPEYRAASLAMTARLRRHLARERQNIATLFRAARVGGAAIWPVRTR